MLRRPDPSPPAIYATLPRVTLAVLAGGSGRRMGGPKPMLPWGSATLIETVVQALRPIAREVLVVGGPPQLGGLPGLSGARHLPDRRPGAGPLAALESALEAAGQPWIALVGCDMPLVEVKVWVRLLRCRRGVLAVLPRDISNRPQPLHALYHRTCLEAVQGTLRSGGADMLGWLEAIPHRLVESSRLGPRAESSWQNLNTPEQLEAARAGLRGRGAGDT